MSLPHPLFELCAESLAAAQAAQAGGADRIELCSGLSCGGLTPDAQLMAASIQAVSIPVYVLIRPRARDFIYSAEEFRLMQRQIEQARAAGASGVALGLLLPGSRIDKGRTCALVDLARPMATVFHRAFDEARDLSEALEDVIATGAGSLLTSGGAPDVLQGAGRIAELARQAAGRISIVAGGGLRLESIVEVARHSGAACLHGSLTRIHGVHTHGEPAAPDQAALTADVREAVRLLRTAHHTAAAAQQI